MLELCSFFLPLLHSCILLLLLAVTGGNLFLEEGCSDGSTEVPHSVGLHSYGFQRNN